MQDAGGASGGETVGELEDEIDCGGCVERAVGADAVAQRAADLGDVMTVSSMSSQP
jgi:hypothetical protein